MGKPITAIILAAGEGSRMRSKQPKVLHPLCGRPMLDWVLRSARAAGVGRRVVVLSHADDRIAQGLPANVRVVRQSRPLGTGHALRAAEASVRGQSQEIVVLCGDTPLLRSQTLRRLIRQHRLSRAQATVLTACVPHPHGYGRILREPGRPGYIARIVEERDATPAERRIDEINSGVYCFSASMVWDLLRKIGNRNRKREYYLTDVVQLLRQQGAAVAAYTVDDASEVFGVNTRQELAVAAKTLNRRMLEEWMDRGVTIMDPETTWVDADVRIGPDTCIWPGTHMLGKTLIGPECTLGPHTLLDSTRIGRGVKITFSLLRQAWIGDRVTVGPFAHLRPGVRVDGDVHIGNYVEMNRSRIHRGVKVGHVSYLGDTVVGRGANIGAGAITANFDGVSKHRTQIGEKAFIGSGTVLVAPVAVGAHALIGAGAVVKAGSRIPAQSVAVGVPARVIKKRRPNL